MRARAGGRKGTNGAWSARWYEDVAAFSVSVETLVSGGYSHVWPAADLSSSYRRFEFLPERKPSLVHDQRSALSAEGGEEEDRELGLWAEVGSRECSRGWVHLVARHDYATAIDLLVPIVETSCSPRCRIKSWMSLPTGTIWSRGMADFTISCLV